MYPPPPPTTPPLGGNYMLFVKPSAKTIKSILILYLDIDCSFCWERLYKYILKLHSSVLGNVKKYGSYKFERPAQKIIRYPLIKSCFSRVPIKGWLLMWTCELERAWRKNSLLKNSGNKLNNPLYYLSVFLYSIWITFS